ncbi:MAG: hypothetical protein UY48_C0003G0033 [Candidatus Gottesmanbacteria bacterium GW2011_GWB1_49_7]|uniref:Mor transcription activator domain-containing protein n=1 Tax=Candidatus Gottesmanbacteria bacterium GW2011_GWB1_49_7 TaxID=1618448 RepID=A0A0G1W382_9BACT|nr:MAG: hypothetical protein UY48_C0003G0033 [Candidatus Gottesmanbacteria bacterium GW2011_GWB1_49_7]
MPHARKVYDAVISCGVSLSPVTMTSRRVVQVIRDRYRGGESVTSLARDYGLSIRRIRIVIQTVRKGR